MAVNHSETLGSSAPRHLLQLLELCQILHDQGQRLLVDAAHAGVGGGSCSVKGDAKLIQSGLYERTPSLFIQQESVGVEQGVDAARVQGRLRSPAVPG